MTCFLFFLVAFMSCCINLLFLLGLWFGWFSALGVVLSALYVFYPLALIQTFFKKIKICFFFHVFAQNLLLSKK